MSNMELYDALRTPPEEAIETIKGGRMSGKSSINPMWRIKALTERFGPCGIGWKYTIDRRWMEPYENGEVKAFVEISLYIKADGEWSEAIPGTGGNSFVAKEKGGPYVSDECYKMAFTDALSVACKSLGMAGDVYWGSDKDKYSTQGDLGFHDIMAVKRRIQEAITRKLKNGVDVRDVLASMDASQKVLDRAMSACDWLARFEQELNRF